MRLYPLKLEESEVTINSIQGSKEGRTVPFAPICSTMKSIN
jgi:hypothetical protein